MERDRVIHTAQQVNENFHGQKVQWVKKNDEEIQKLVKILAYKDNIEFLEAKIYLTFNPKNIFCFSWTPKADI